MVKLIFIESDYRKKKELSNEFHFFRVITDRIGNQMSYIASEDEKIKNIYSGLGFQVIDKKDIKTINMVDKHVSVSTTSTYLNNKKLFSNSNIIILIDKLLPDQIKCIPKHIENLSLFIYPETEENLVKIVEAYIEE